jgi:hypothetical protein
MAKRKKQRKEDAPLPTTMRKHIEALGFSSPDAYLAWCHDRGFAPTTDKAPHDIREETEACRSERKQARERARVDKNPRKFIKMTCAEEISPDELHRSTWRAFCETVHASRTERESRDALCELLLMVEAKANFVFDSTSFGGHSYRFVDALVRLNDRRGQWIRPLADWRPDSHNRDRQFSSLARHLMAQYSVPCFMDSAWFRRDRGSHRLRDWFVHIGSGKNIRTAKTPVPLTKRQAHSFLQAPDQYSIENAIRWGQIHALGGDRRLTDAVCGTQIGEAFANDDFWTTVLRFFVANPMLARRHVGPIVDYLNNQRFLTREVVTGPGIVEMQPPPQPNLTMRGRTAESLLRQVDEWHGQLGRSKAAANLWFRPSGFSGL